MVRGMSPRKLWMVPRCQCASPTAGWKRIQLSSSAMAFSNSPSSAKHVPRRKSVERGQHEDALRRDVPLAYALKEGVRAPPRPGACYGCAYLADGFGLV